MLLTATTVHPGFPRTFHAKPRDTTPNAPWPITFSIFRFPRGISHSWSPKNVGFIATGSFMSSLQKDLIFDCFPSVMFSRVAIDIFSMSKIVGYATDLKSSASQLISRLRQRSRALARHRNFWLFWSFYPCRKIQHSHYATLSEDKGFLARFVLRSICSFAKYFVGKPQCWVPCFRIENEKTFEYFGENRGNKKSNVDIKLFLRWKEVHTNVELVTLI